MKKYRKHIDDFFREKLGRYAETPPPEVWEDLEKRLDGLVPPTGNISYRWARHFAIVSVIVLLSVPFLKKLTGDATTQLAANTSTNAPANSTNNNGVSAESNAAVPSVTTASTSENNTAQNTEATLADKGITNNPAVANGSDLANDEHNNDQHNQNRSGRKTIAVNANKANHFASQPLVQHAKYVADKGSNHKDVYYASNPVSSGDHAPESATGDNMPAAKPAAGNDPLSQPEQEKKEEKVAADKKKEDAPKSIKQQFARFEMGFKAGYEKGFSDAAANKFVVGPYMQYNISRRISVMTQPSLKYANVSSRKIGPTQSYYQVNPDGTVKQNWDSVTISVDGSSIDTTHRTSYHYSQSHDSIVKSYTYGGSYFEVELPILLKYAVTDKCSFYGGLNLAYSQLATVSEHTYTQHGINTSIDKTTSGNSAQTPAPTPISDVITYSGTPYANYSAPLFSIAQKSQLSVGYMVGFSYEYSKKWLFDALVQQTNLKPDIKGGFNVNAPLSMPYFRLSIGYKLLKK